MIKIDIDDERNGLLLLKPIEWAFDTGRLFFVFDDFNNTFYARVLDPDIGQMTLAEKLDDIYKVWPLHNMHDQCCHGWLCDSVERNKNT